MNPQGTSFIPQRPTHGKTAPRRVRKIYVLAYLSYVLFFGSLLAAAGVFFFSFSLNIQLEKQQQLLASERQQFNQGDIESIRDLERRINIAEERLSNHVSVLSIFEALEASAVQSINFVSFTYKRLGDEFPTVTFTGDSDRFNNVLFQREVLASNPVLAGSTFEEIAMQTIANEQGGNGGNEIVRFTLEKEIDTSLIGYTPRQSSGTEIPQAETQQSDEGFEEGEDIQNSDTADSTEESTSSETQ